MAQEAKRAGQSGSRKGGTEGAQGVEGEREEMAGEGKGDFSPSSHPRRPIGGSHVSAVGRGKIFHFSDFLNCDKLQLRNGAAGGKKKTLLLHRKYFFMKYNRARGLYTSYCRSLLRPSHSI